MGASEEVAPTLAILLEAIAEEKGVTQDQLSVELESKTVSALLEAYRLGQQSVYNRPTVPTPMAFPAVRPDTKSYEDED